MAVVRVDTGGEIMDGPVISAPRTRLQPVEARVDRTARKRAETGESVVHVSSELT